MNTAGQLNAGNSFTSYVRDCSMLEDAQVLPSTENKPRHRRPPNKRAIRRVRMAIIFAILLIVCVWGRAHVAEYAHAWSEWMQGRTVKGKFWGLDTVWVVRLGKFLMFIAGITIVLDLIGAARLKRLRGWLVKMMTSTHRMMRDKNSGIKLYTKEAAVSVFELFSRSLYMAAANRGLAPMSAETSKRVVDKPILPPSRGGKIFFLAGLSIFMGAYLILAQWLRPWLPTSHINSDPMGTVRVFEFALVGTISTAVANLALYGILAVLLTILWISLCFISMGIYVAEAHRSTHSFRWLMFAVATFGFHFDLLLS